MTTSGPDGTPTSVRVLFVCTGNICRSPTAEGTLRKLVADAGLADRVVIDSCGLGSWHVGDPPDPRTVRAAAARGLDLSDQRARQVRPGDFDAFDLLVAMDRGHRKQLVRLAPAGRGDRVVLFCDFAPGIGPDVPDPYYGGVGGFDHVLDMVETGCRGLLDHLRAHHLAA